MLYKGLMDFFLLFQQQYISDKIFRVYLGTDIISCEIAGACKNVLAIASGASDGFGFGYNARAALITRGLAEMCRLVVAKGGDARTLMGLSGVGDLVLTCTGTLSRNYTTGKMLAEGKTIDEIKASSKAVAEGVFTALAIHQMAAKLGVDMPICEQVYKVPSSPSPESPLSSRFFFFNWCHLHPSLLPLLHEAYALTHYALPTCR